MLKYKANGKYGLINLKGEKLTKPIYQDIQTLEYKQGMLLVKKDEKYGVINLKGKIIINTKYDKIECDRFYSEDTKSQNAGFIVANKISGNYKYGYINNIGKKILDLKYDELSRIPKKSSSNDVYLVAYENSQAKIYKNNKNILKSEYENIEYDTLNEVLIVQKNNKNGIVNLEGKEIIAQEYDNIFIAGNCINAQNADNILLFNIDGSKIENDNYISMFNIENKYIICVNKDDYYGVLDENKNQLIENKYELISYLWDDFFIAKKDDKFGIINSKDEKIIEFKFENLQKIDNFQIVEGIIDNKTCILNKDFKEKCKLQDVYLKVENEYLKLFSISDKEIVYLNKIGDIVESKNVLKDNKLFANKVDGKWNFIDKDGNKKIKEDFDFVTEFNTYGFAGIYINGKWGVITENGDILQEPKYELDEKNEPNFIGKFYEEYLGYGEKYYKSE